MQLEDRRINAKAQRPQSHAEGNGAGDQHRFILPLRCLEPELFGVVFHGGKSLTTDGRG